MLWVDGGEVAVLGGRGSQPDAIVTFGAGQGRSHTHWNEFSLTIIPEPAAVAFLSGLGSSADCRRRAMEATEKMNERLSRKAPMSFTEMVRMGGSASDRGFLPAFWIGRAIPEDSTECRTVRNLVHSTPVNRKLLQIQCPNCQSHECDFLHYSRTGHCWSAVGAVRVAPGARRSPAAWPEEVTADRLFFFSQ